MCQSNLPTSSEYFENIFIILKSLLDSFSVQLFSKVFLALAVLVFSDAVDLGRKHSRYCKILGGCVALAELFETEELPIAFDVCSPSRSLNLWFLGPAHLILIALMSKDIIQSSSPLQSNGFVIS